MGFNCVVWLPLAILQALALMADVASSPDLCPTVEPVASQYQPEPLALEEPHITVEEPRPSSNPPLSTFAATIYNISPSLTTDITTIAAKTPLGHTVLSGGTSQHQQHTQSQLPAGMWQLTFYDY